MEPTAEPTFLGVNLRVARNFNGMTLTELARLVSVSHAMIHHLEAGARKPGPDLDAALAQALGFETDFFYLPLPEEFHEEQCQFRGRPMPASLKTRVLAHGTLFGSFVRFLEKRVKLPPVAIPEESAGDKETIERAAENCRRRLGIGLDRPALSICRVLENWGAVVTRFEGSTEKSDALRVDAFSRAGGRPVVVLNTDKGSTSRSRWDMSHELGHLVMHPGIPPGDPLLETQADQFASAFLLPRVGFLREFHPQKRLNWDTVWGLKHRWKASGASIVRRAYDFGLIDAIEYRRAWKHYMYKGWHKGEPYEPDDEAPELVPQALEFLRSRKGISTLDMAKTLGWRAETFERIVGVPAVPLAPVPSQGGNLVSLERVRKRMA
ncbi:XRE family transcriptional regulator [Archangium sp.]|uniref:helix-turn-helix domain-containing protein n=1 Tax=Archangium sp. TaxID=1872627 RepID=UPI002D40627D|nr:XRE family transcriptional regulator [Archangium sp.]HYO53459.1 XRE family transcriptional regulator [Archangium sp.]